MSGATWLRIEVLGTVLLLAGCVSLPADAPLRLNDIQALASHNSYKQAMDAALLERLLVDVGADLLALDYAHPALARQLDLGLLKLELDVFHDPEGGRYAAPAGLALLRALAQPSAAFNAEVLQAPGFKVLHLQDFDFRSHCPTLSACLRVLRTWSEAHPAHLPIAVSINAKQAPLPPGAGAVVPLPFDAAAWDALDAELIAGLGRERLLTPDDVRGDRRTLRQAVRRRGWPLLDDVRGRFLFVLDEPMAVLAGYLAGHASLRGRVMFANVPEAHPAAAFLILNEPISQGERIRAAVAAGYLVRTRADADTWEARDGNTERRDAAFASGAHYVSTDFYLPDSRFKSGYHVVLPGGAPVRCNAVRRPAAGCLVPRLPRP